MITQGMIIFTWPPMTFACQNEDLFDLQLLIKQGISQFDTMVKIVCGVSSAHSKTKICYKYALETDPHVDNMDGYVSRQIGR